MKKQKTVVTFGNQLVKGSEAFVRELKARNNYFMKRFK